MRNGLFMDISEYYDGDTGLNKSGFNPAIMEAGVYEGGRYILPLRYNTPVLYLTEDAFSASGLDADSLGSGLSGILEAADAVGADAVGVEYSHMYLYWMDLLPQMIDYETQELTVSQEEMAAFLEEYRALVSRFDEPSIPKVNPSYINYVSSDEFWAKNGGGVHIGNLDSLIQNIKMSKVSGTELVALPLCASDGTRAASVTQWAAVGAGCNDPELAYEFVRELLMEESQWTDFGYVGFPVLTEGAWAAMDAEMVKEPDIGAGAAAGAKKRKRLLRETVVEDEDYYALYAEFDRVRLPQADTVEYMYAIENWVNSGTDAETFAQELLHEIQLHTAEG